MKKKITFVPKQGEGEGTGHFHRCSLLAKELKDTFDTSILLGKNDASNSSAPSADIFVIDNRATSTAEFFRYMPAVENPPLFIGLDEGGRSRSYFHYLIDTLPAPPEFIQPNIYSLHGTKWFSGHMKSGPVKRVLISFGGEDKARLSYMLLEVLLKEQLFSPEYITLVQGPSFRDTDWPEGIRIIKSPSSMKEILQEHDLLFTHFGLTAFEGLALGIPVILLNPTNYHRRLSHLASIPEAGTGRVNLGRLKALLADMSWAKGLNRMFDEGMDLTALLSSIRHSGYTSCPVCKKGSNKALLRFREKTYFRCPVCSLIYMIYFRTNPDLYREEYFFSDYKKQYGRTYLEDFETIRRFSESRLHVIQKITGSPAGKKFLDVGCAYGPFLSTIKEAGGIPSGTDISAQAVEYVANELKIPCRCCSFTDYPEEECYDVLSMWYVIEHFTDLDLVLRKASSLLKEGGIFAFSTPNFSGISGKIDKKKFLSASPGDHYTVWQPSIAGGILKKYGFKIEKIRITGHHPERFPGIKSDKSLLYKIAGGISRIFSLGDTFEIYARKVENIEK